MKEFNPRMIQRYATKSLNKEYYMKSASELIDEAVRGASPHVDLQNLKFELERDFKSSLQKANRGRLDKKQVDVLKISFSVAMEKAFEDWIESAKSG